MVIGTETSKEHKLKDKLRNARKIQDRVTELEDQIVALSEQLAELRRQIKVAAERSDRPITPWVITPVIEPLRPPYRVTF